MIRIVKQQENMKEANALIDKLSEILKNRA